MQGNLLSNALIDNDLEVQQRLLQQPASRAPVRLPSRIRLHVAAVHLVGHTGQDGCQFWRQEQG
eukprot:2516812-Pyramimonas_sp.AAC.1